MGRLDTCLRTIGHQCNETILAPKLMLPSCGSPTHQTMMSQMWCYLVKYLITNLASMQVSMQSNGISTNQQQHAVFSVHKCKPHCRLLFKCLKMNALSSGFFYAFALPSHYISSASVTQTQPPKVAAPFMHSRYGCV